MAVKQLRTMDDLGAILAASNERPVFVFKHSTTCPISARAHGQWVQFLATPEAADADTAMVRVIEERPISLAFADRVGVAHQSPQALLISKGRAVWNDSHGAITVNALKSALQKV